MNTLVTKNGKDEIFYAVIAKEKKLLKELKQLYYILLLNGKLNMKYDV